MVPKEGSKKISVSDLIEILNHKNPLRASYSGLKSGV